jgi:hypothetical protein
MICDKDRFMCKLLIYFYKSICCKKLKFNYDNNITRWKNLPQ